MFYHAVKISSVVTLGRFSESERISLKFKVLVLSDNARKSKEALYQMGESIELVSNKNVLTEEIGERRIAEIISNLLKNSYQIISMINVHPWKWVIYSYKNL